MNATFDAKQLADAVAAVANAVAPRTTKPVLAQVKLDVHGGTATVTATDTEVAVRRVVECGGADDGAVLIDPKKAGDWLRKVRGDVTVSVKGEEVVLSAGKTRLQLPYLSPDEFPDVPAQGDGAAKFVLPGGVLQSLLTRAEYAADKKEGARWACSCVLLVAGPTGVKAVATDTKRLALVTAPGEYPQGEVKLPLKAVSLVLKNGGNEEVEVTLGANAATFRTATWFIHTRLVEGKFPPYQQIIPKQLSHVAELRASDLANAVELAAVATDDQAKRVELHFHDGLCEIAARSGAGESDSECEVPGFDGDVTLALDPAYVLDGLKVNDKNAVVRVRMTGNEKPVLFECGDNWTGLIMPLGERE